MPLKVIIVDDDHQKVQQIRELLDGESIGCVFEHFSSGASARARLRKDNCDLLLVDLCLPESAGGRPKTDGGIDFFDLLLADPLSHIPSTTSFVTAIQPVSDSCRNRLLEHGVTLCEFSSASTLWKKSILGLAKRSARLSKRSTNIIVDFAVITALNTPELDAVLKLPYGWVTHHFPDDPTTYHLGKISSAGKTATIVAASAQKKGMAWSSSLATKIILRFRPKLLAMTGICAGVKDKTSLGDVVVADPAWDWGSGKHAESESGSPVFRLSPVQRPLSSVLSGMCHEISRSAAFKQRIRADWSHATPAGHFSAHVGPMASGASVIANTSTAALISEQNRDLIAIEMEAFAVMAASEYAISPSPMSIAIKSVCDFADKEKRDDWQSYAAYTSAQFANELFAMCIDRGIELS
ncbi:response regulator [Hydrogenophaga aromaticivorans]|uniref:5'-methylthioadenosine/S-adenosylhomocysteine nucleosidase family protein n=1 Tax=Hydrogenophaga aromaticivorans TaxID=2610898 RepID=UPI001B3752E7|nr:response regulator [Hydrogenophaga aromaticivorans]MBQ0921404.1 response regulator [Hydrogenophaga aromaticivorans]